MLAHTNERVNKNSKKGLLLMQQPFFIPFYFIEGGKGGIKILLGGCSSKCRSKK